MNKKGAVVTIVLIALGILLLAIFLGGFTIGIKVIGIINSIPLWGWILIILFILWMMGGKKK